MNDVPATVETIISDPDDLVHTSRKYLAEKDAEIAKLKVRVEELEVAARIGLDEMKTWFSLDECWCEDGCVCVHGRLWNHIQDVEQALKGHET